MAETGGKMAASGEVRAEKNPEAPARKGARFEGVDVAVRLGADGEPTVRLLGRASYLGRTLTSSVDVDAPASLKKALADLADEHADDIEQRTMEAAYEAARVARLRGEEG